MFSVSTAAIILNDYTTFTEDFNGFDDGNELSLPANFTATHDLGSGAFDGRVLTSGSSGYNPATGWYSLNDDDTPLDFAFGARTNATSGEGYLFFTVTNQTGGEITGINLNFDVEQYSSSDSGSNLNVSARTDANAYGTSNLTGNVTTTIPDENLANSVYDNPAVTARSVEWNQTVANGDSVDFRFYWEVTAGGARPHFGVDNVAIVAVPEANTAALLSLFGIALLIFRRRR